ncbi:MAG TPA: hypothetical protein VFO85_18520 [Vicinamibacteria bacterium]|nr:hypothetical protein [Vicinamibacteria bacterium]
MAPRSLAVYAGPACPHCEAPLDLAGIVAGQQACRACARTFEAVSFRPPPRRAQVSEVAAAGPEAPASCAAHRRNVAVAACERCGIFMCALCSTEADGLSICAPCFERLAAEGALHSAGTRYPNYLGLAWLAGLTGVLLWLPGLVTGPAAIYYAVRGLRQMSEWGDVGGRGRAVAAMAVGVVSTIQGAAVVAALVS